MQRSIDVTLYNFNFYNRGFAALIKCFRKMGGYNDIIVDNAELVFYKN